MQFTAKYDQIYSGMNLNLVTKVLPVATNFDQNGTAAIFAMR